MNPFIELMQAGALIMLLFAVVLILVVLRNVERASFRLRLGPIVIGLALLLFAAPVYAGVISSKQFRFSTPCRLSAALLLPIGLYLLSPLRTRLENFEADAPETAEGDGN
ncbi:MAG: hypothetical protein M3238_08295 [Actinomycetota bacterium]|nr:hypothetical protein [Actinomycetota bacterium]